MPVRIFLFHVEGHGFVLAESIKIRRKIDHSYGTIRSDLDDLNVNCTRKKCVWHSACRLDSPEGGFNRGLSRSWDPQKAA